MFAIEQKAKKYKKLFEKIHYQPNSIEINGVTYFEVLYMKKDEIAGMAVFPADDYEDIQDAVRAHALLAVYNSMIGAIYETAHDRSQIPNSVFEEPIELLQSKEELTPVLQKGLERIKELFDWQKRFVSIYKESGEFYRDPRNVTHEAIDYIHDQSSELTLSQIYIMNIVADDDQVLMKWQDELKGIGLWKKLSQHTRDFYSFINIEQEREITKAARDDFPVLPEGDLSEQLAFVKEDLANHHQRWIRDFREKLRWPQV
ncbi:hypothetical protein [Jeotgalibacillus sp. JSM ZJ347]|uniref:hypothetical protein n=1 Tax=Jeotgalibacillus sp. JSM ZJ347 TaxID=3342117 RepID=UPI0035A90A25